MARKTVDPFEPAQADFVFCDDRFTGFIGGVGSGKSYAGAIKSLRAHGNLCAAGYTPLGLIVAPTYPMLRDATLRTFMDIAEEGVSEFLRTEMRATLQWGGEVLFRSADKPDRLRGPNIHYAWIDEGALCPDQTWDIVIGRLRADGMAGPCWVTTTPKGRNWLYARQDMMTIFRASVFDNPYLDEEFKASLEQAYAGNFALQELYGEFVAFEGLVYEAFDRGIHVIDEVPDGLRDFVIGVDEGFTNPSVLLVIGFDGDGRAYVVDEFYRRRVLQGDVVAYARDEYMHRYTRNCKVDPSAAGLVAALNDAQMNAEPAHSNVMGGIGQIQARLAKQADGRPRLFVHSSCANTIAEFESYCWKKGREGFRDEPEKVNDHAMDALRYVIGGGEMVPLSAVPQPKARSKWVRDWPDEGRSKWRMG